MLNRLKKFLIKFKIKLILVFDLIIRKVSNIRNLNAYSKSYINHLINSNEILASMILTLNNIFFYQQLMKKIREAIKTNSFDKFYNKYVNII